MSAEPVVASTFTMIGSDTASACEGDACVVVVEPVVETVADEAD